MSPQSYSGRDRKWIISFTVLSLSLFRLNDEIREDNSIAILIRHVHVPCLGIFAI